MAAPTHFDPWSPSRPFPVQRWQAQRFAFRVPHPPPTGPRPLIGQQRRDFELDLLVSQLPLWLRAPLLRTLRWEAKRRAPWSRERCAAGAPKLAQKRFPAPTLGSSSVHWLRAMLVSECEIGLTTIQTPLDWFSRPLRNHALAMRAARLGQLAQTLEHQPEAEPPEQEAERTLAALRR